MCTLCCRGWTPPAHTHTLPLSTYVEEHSANSIRNDFGAAYHLKANMVKLTAGSQSLHRECLHRTCEHGLHLCLACSSCMFHKMGQYHKDACTLTLSQVVGKGQQRGAVGSTPGPRLSPEP